MKQLFLADFTVTALLLHTWHDKSLQIGLKGLGQDTRSNANILGVPEMTAHGQSVDRTRPYSRLAVTHLDPIYL